MLIRISIIVIALSLAACSSWVYRIDIPQGNFLEQKNIDKIQVGMTKEQIKFVLGSPVLIDSFDQDTWHYVYRFKSGRSKDLDIQKTFKVTFSQDKLISADGDFELSEKFSIPFNTPITQPVEAYSDKATSS